MSGFDFQTSFSQAKDAEWEVASQVSDHDARQAVGGQSWRVNLL